MSLCFGLACKRVAGSCTLKAFKMFLVHKIWSALKYSESVLANVPVRQWELNNWGQCSSGLACTQDYSKPLHTMTLVISVSPLWLFYSCSLILLIFTPNCPLLKVEEGGMCPVWKIGERVSEGEMRRGWECCVGRGKLKVFQGSWYGQRWGEKGHLGTIQLLLEVVRWPRWAPDLCCFAFLGGRGGKQRDMKQRGAWIWREGPGKGLRAIKSRD